MDQDTIHRVHVIVGIYTIVCLVNTYFYGCFSIAAWLVGLFLIGALLNAFRGGPSKKL